MALKEIPGFKKRVFECIKVFPFHVQGLIKVGRQAYKYPNTKENGGGSYYIIGGHLASCSLSIEMVQNFPEFWKEVFDNDILPRDGWMVEPPEEERLYK
jgi:hypothetical protein